MTYATQSALIAEFGDAELIALTDRADPPTGAIDSTALNRAIARAANDNTAVAACSDLVRLVAKGAKVEAWADLVSDSPNLGSLYAGSGTVSLVDRTDLIDKAYGIDCNGVIVPVASGQTAGYVMGWGARLIA